MRRALIGGLVAALVSAGATPAFAKTNEDKFRYQFSTIFVPEASASEERLVAKRDAWFFGRRTPSLSVRVLGDVEVPDAEFSDAIRSGDMIILAQGNEIYGCERDSPQDTLWTIYKKLCLADFDKDGAFESYYLNNDHPYADFHVQTEEKKDFRPMPPVRYEPVPVRAYDEMDDYQSFFGAYVGSKFAICLGAPVKNFGPICLTDGAKIKPTTSWQTFTYRGGIFSVREHGPDQLAIRIEKPFDAFEYPAFEPKP
ncbi:hypothetical protein EAO27_06880 [Sphingopyxis sp. YF1]|uniref:hypothetical protein n=1 Tax=Sphingopyxis sp. YF1 TaxID=2482763 RepID=UPI001F61B3B8|nr:hypothetical protein [Sphingopyxis sp. YF1]UNU42463.1 hypothetical protein EAO27_06880 [Sphingopyxis sp. YF1]